MRKALFGLLLCLNVVHGDVEMLRSSARLFGELYRDAAPAVVQVGEGLGFLVSADGALITHESLTGESLQVQTASGELLEAQLVESDPLTGLALLQVAGTDWPHLSLGNSNVEGEWLLAMTGESYTAGIGIKQELPGGPLLNLDGEVVGIGSRAEPIPSNLAHQLLDREVVQHGLVMQRIGRDLADLLGLGEAEGMLVADVAPESMAAKRGIQQGDLVLSIEESVIELSREGERMRVDLAEAPQARVRLGIAVEREHSGEGVLVQQVERDSAGSAAGLRPGTLITRVNRTIVETPEELSAALGSAREQGPRALLLVKQGQLVRFLTVRLDGE